ncbi:MAG: hypothetical protein IKU66_02700 [Clostridia bacterium]|nr:hypothetical protein [Clostridia bacterium]
MNACELTATITVIANSIATKLTDDEIAALSTVLVQLGDTLATIITHRSLCENCSNISGQKGNATKNTEA